MSKLNRRLTALSLAIGGLLLLPATGQAQVFGSGFVHDPNQRDCEMLGPCTVAAVVEIPGEGVLTEAGAPIDGVITKFRIAAKVETPTQVTFRVVSVNPITSATEPVHPKSATAVATGTGPTLTLRRTVEEEEAAGRTPIQEVAARVAVRKGQHIGIDAPSNLVASYNSSGSDKFSYEYAPPLVDGAGERLSNQALGELLVQATVEPDADGDGFGDETQDQCPSQKMTQGPCDRTKPKIAKLHVRKGKVSYRLSEASTVSLQLAKRKGHAFKMIGRAFSGPGSVGSNQRNLPGARHLSPGLYRLSIAATDVLGNTATRTTTFHVKG